MFTSGAQADFQSCVGTGYDISTKVSTATDCTILLPLDGAANDNPMPGFVNSEAFFGITTWMYDGKWDNLNNSGGTSDELDLFTFSGNNQSGNYTASPTTGIDQVMFVFKDGAGTNLVGYLLGMTSGEYSSPFVNPPLQCAWFGCEGHLAHQRVLHHQQQFYQ